MPGAVRPRVGISSRRAGFGLAVALLLAQAMAPAAQAPPPELTAPVNDFAGVIDPASAAELDRMIRVLQAATSDVVVVATVDTIEPYADVREYAVKMFENHGRGVGLKGRDNGLLVLVAVKQHEVRVEVGYELESFVTDGFAGELSRQVMVPSFRRGEYGPGSDGRRRPDHRANRRGPKRHAGRPAGPAAATGRAAHQRCGRAVHRRRHHRVRHRHQLDRRRGRLRRRPEDRPRVAQRRRALRGRLRRLWRRGVRRRRGRWWIRWFRRGRKRRGRRRSELVTH